VNRLSHPLAAPAVAVLLTLPWLAVRATGTRPGTELTVLWSGLAILGASFLLARGAETAEKMVYTAVYMVLGTALFVRRRHRFRELFGLTGLAVRRALGREVPTPEGLE
jgi:cation:H+ antiporter